MSTVTFTWRHLVKQAKFTEVRGGSISKHHDFFKVYTSPGKTIDGLEHIDEETATVWADGLNRGTYTVDNCCIQVESEWTNVVVGIAYTADYTSNKLNYSNMSTLTEFKRVVNTGLILRHYAPGSLKVGPNTSNLDDMPLIEEGSSVGTATLTDYDHFPFEFDGATDSDSRIYMRATGPVTVMAMTYDVEPPAKRQYVTS